MALFGRDYDRDYGYYGGRYRGPDRMYGGGWAGYDQEYGYGAGPGGYDREFGYKSRWQTDYGDPFGDRISHTPMRVIRGEFHRGHGAGYGGYDRDVRYGGSPVRYEPYTGRGYADRGFDTRGSRWNRGSMWGRGANRGWGPDIDRGYDRGWF